MVNDDLFVRLRYQKGLDRIEAVKKVDVFATDREQNTFLHEAAVLNDVVLATFLIENSLRLESKNEHGSTPLHYAVGNLHHEWWLFFLREGPIRNELDNRG